MFVDQLEEFKTNFTYFIHEDKHKQGVEIRTDKELKTGDVLIVKHIRIYALIVDEVWEENGIRHSTIKDAEGIVACGETPVNH